MKTMLRRLALAVMITPFLFAGLAIAQDLPGASGEKVYVKVTQNREISGTPVGLAEIKITTSFGEVSIPLEKIDGVKMKADANGNAVVAFKNGDMVTGKVTLETVDLKTDWGEAHVNTSAIETITSSENGRFYNDNASGSGAWRFSKAPPIPASQLNRPGN